jgi:hypothetical protein
MKALRDTFHLWVLAAVFSLPAAVGAQPLFTSLTRTADITDLAVFDGDLWVASEGGVEVYDLTGQKARLLRSLRAEHGLLGNRVHDLQVIDHTLYALSQGGLTQWDKKARRFRSVPSFQDEAHGGFRRVFQKPPPLPLATAHLEDPSGWKATGNSLGDVVITAGQKKRVFSFPGAITALSAIPHRLLVFSSEGIFRIEGMDPIGSQRRFVVEDRNPALCVLRLPNGTILVGSEKGQILRRTTRGDWTRFYPGVDVPPQNVTALARTKMGLAVGLSGGGVILGSQRLSPATEPCANHIASLTHLEDKLVVGTFDQGVCLIAPTGQTRILRAPDTLRSDLINRVVVDGKNLWVGTGDGLARLRRGKVESWAPGWGNPFKLSAYGVVGVAATPRHLYFADGKGITQVGRTARGKRTRYRNLPALSESITHIDAAGSEVWAATEDHGVSRFDGRRWVRHDMAHGLAEEWVVTIEVSADGRVWAGHSLKGLSFYDGNTWRVISDKDNLVDGSVVSILHLAPEDRVVVGTLGGISILDARAGRVLCSFDIEDGLTDNRVHALSRRGDELVLGTEAGMSKTRVNDLLQRCADPSHISHRPVAK